MRRTSLIAIALLYISCSAWAQRPSYLTSNKLPERRSTERNFDMPERFINIRDFVYLPDNGRMILELNNTEQYNELKNLDSVLKEFIRNIAFYKDSLENGSNHLRIDYTIDGAYSFCKIRFKKYTADGNVFMNNNGDVARLKLEQDTVRLYFRHNPVLPRQAGNGNLWAKNYDYNHSHAGMFQVTFYVNSYSDLAKIAMDTASLQKAIDTLAATKRKATRLSPYKFPSTAAYNPYSTETSKENKTEHTQYNTLRFKQYNGLVKQDNAPRWEALRRSDALEFYANVGVGLVRNTFAPVGEIGMAFSMSGKRLFDNKYHGSSILMYHSAYFFFEQNSKGDYLAKDNWFLNLEYKQDDRDYFVSGFGLGYLYGRRGDYFKGTTMKAFLNVNLHKNGITLCPELIITNDFKQVIPGITLKVF
jgi:hypothetical protein